MERLTKPERLSVDPNNPEGAKQWKHWVRTFENYIESVEQARPEGDLPVNKLQLLINSIDFKVYDYIKDCALNTLQKNCCLNQCNYSRRRNCSSKLNEIMQTTKEQISQHLPPLSRKQKHRIVAEAPLC